MNSNYFSFINRTDVTQAEGAGIRQVGEAVDGPPIREARGGQQHLQRGPDPLPRQALSGTAH